MSAAPRSREETAVRRRGEVLDAAETLVAVHGYDALRLRDVSAAAGVSIGLIQHYFATRDDLLLETMRVASQRRVQQWSQLAADAASPTEKVRALIEGAIGDHHRCVVWLETCAAATRHPELRPDVERTQRAWREAIVSALTERAGTGGMPGGASAEDMAELLVRLIDGFLLDAAVDNSALGHERRTRLLRIAAAQLLGLA